MLVNALDALNPDSPATSPVSVGAGASAIKLGVVVV